MWLVLLRQISLQLAYVIGFKGTNITYSLLMWLSVKGTNIIIACLCDWCFRDKYPDSLIMWLVLMGKYPNRLLMWLVLMGQISL